MPGFILEEGSTAQLRYSFHAPTLARDFPNLDRADEDLHTAVDMFTLSFLLTGTDSTGARTCLARQIVIDGEHVLMPDQPAAPARRRTAAQR
jgi:hypothetical protein